MRVGFTGCSRLATGGAGGAGGVASGYGGDGGSGGDATGGSTGAVTLELARKASDGTVYAVERKPEAVALLHENRIKLGGYNVKIIEGPAP